MARDLRIPKIPRPPVAFKHATAIRGYSPATSSAAGQALEPQAAPIGDPRVPALWFVGKLPKL